MKRGYNKILYNQRNKDETIVSVIKRLFGEHIASKLTRMQNRELAFRCIAYNVNRMVKLIVMTWFLQSQKNNIFIIDKLSLRLIVVNTFSYSSVLNQFHKSNPYSYFKRRKDVFIAKRILFILWLTNIKGIHIQFTIDGLYIKPITSM